MGPVEGDAQFSVSSLGSIVYIPGGIIMCPREGVWVDRKGKARPIAESLPVAGNLQLSPDGKAVALGLGSAAKVDVYTFDLERGIATKVSGSGDDYQALWTHDSRKLVYISGRLGGQTLFSRNADGTGPEEPLTTNEGTKRPTSTLGDGTIAFSWRTTGPWGVWTLSPQSKPAKPTPLLTNSWNQVDAVFSPDGKWLAYSSDESGKMEVYVQSYPEGTSKLRVSGEGGSVPRWSRDGRELFYTTQSKLMAVQSVNTERFQPGKPGMLFEAQNYVLYDVSLDGKEFLMMRLDESTAVTRFNWLPVSRAVQLSQR